MSRGHWIQIPGTHEFAYKGRTYRNMARFERPCATCGDNFPIFVTHKVADGGASSNNFQLKNCEKHRMKRVPFNGEASAAAPSDKPATGFPRTTVQNGKYVTENAVADEIDQLRMANNVMKEELDGLYTRNKELFAEIQVLKAQLAKYELGPAMAAMQNKMPWQ